MVMPISPSMRTIASRRQEFISNLLAITGDTRVLWVPQASDTTTATDASLNQRTITHAATTAGRMTSQGFGQLVTFNGTSHYSSAPDAAELTFNGTSDVAFSVIVLANVTNTAAARIMLCKEATNATTIEYRFGIASDDTLELMVGDDTAAKYPYRRSNAAITQGSVALFSGTYSAATGGATAANDITLYQNGAAIASTATNDALYVKMQNTTGLFYIGDEGNGTQSFFSGSMGLAVLCQKNMSASDHWAVKELVNAYFGLSL